MQDQRFPPVAIKASATLWKFFDIGDMVNRIGGNHPRLLLLKLSAI